MIQYFKLKKEGKTVQIMVAECGNCIRRYGIDFSDSKNCTIEYISLEEFREIGRRYNFFTRMDEPISASPTPLP